MVQFNFFRREVNCKIVYYGPGLSGKTTNLEVVHQKTPGAHRGELTSIATEQDRTLFFDFMPIDLGQVAGMKTKLRLFTVPGQVFYNSTRKLVLQGADGVIFVADSQADKIEANKESLKNLEENLREQGVDIRSIPLIIQWNKRDMPNALPVEVLEKEINIYGAPTFEAVAVTGEGVFQTLKKCAALVLKKVSAESQAGFRSTPRPSFGRPKVPQGFGGGKPAAIPKAPEMRPAPLGAQVPASQPNSMPTGGPVTVPKAVGHLNDAERDKARFQRFRDRLKKGKGRN